MRPSFTDDVAVGLEADLVEGMVEDVGMVVEAVVEGIEGRIL